MTEQVEGTGVAERLAVYELSVDAAGLRERESRPGSEAIDELAEKAAVLIAVMPPNQRRDTIEKLVAPNDPEKGRRAVDTLLEAALAHEDVHGHLHRLG